MGAECSRHRRPKMQDVKIDLEEKNNDTFPETDSRDVAIFDLEAIQKIKEDLNERPDMFVLNNILMCTLFYKNYQEEILRVIDKVESDHARYWEPDVIIERANHNVIYRPMHGEKKDIAEPLVKRRIYVPLDEYVRVFSPMNDDEEDVAKKMNSKFQVKTELAKKNGYVKLQRLKEGDTISFKDSNHIPSSSSNTSVGSDTESTGTSLAGVFVRPPELIKDQIDQMSLEDCFVARPVKKLDLDIELENMDLETLTEEDIHDIVDYLSARRFMLFFQSRVFRESVANQLGLLEYEIDHAGIDKYVPGKIFCNLKDDLGNCYPLEVLPCLKVSWPLTQTHTFLASTLSIDACKKTEFQWPTKDILEDMKKLECALVPKCYSKRLASFAEGELEWEYHFPRAESYLETILSPQQIKCYLILVTLYKEYLEPRTGVRGVVPEHFLTLIFWESEKDYFSWPEHRLGIKLMKLIETFSESLSKRQMRDYFIRKKNVFKNVSRRHLEPANELFHWIKESPLMPIVKALRNIRYINGSSFYPPMDYNKLLNILYRKNWDEESYLNNLVQRSLSCDELSLTEPSMNEKKNKYSKVSAEKLLELKKLKNKREVIKERKAKKNGPESFVDLRYSLGHNNRRGSVDSINDNWECEKRFGRQKKIALLKFFIDNFLDIARTSFKIGTNQQSLFYLKQAWYLTSILYVENQLFADEVTGYFNQIKLEESKVIQSMQENIRNYGSLNARNSSEVDSDVKPELDNSEDVEIRNRSIGKRNAKSEIYEEAVEKKNHLGTFCRSFSLNFAQSEYCN